MLRAEVDRHKGQPNDAGRVHGEADELRLVEVLRNLARSHREQRAEEDQQHVVRLREQERFVLDVAAQNDALAAGIVASGAGRLDDHPHERDQELDAFGGLRVFARGLWYFV